MIFNSISREINRDDYRKDYQLKNSKSSYFPQKQYTPSNLFENIPEPTYPPQKNESAIAKMNSKITDNIEYLRYKDKLRTNQLRSSRVSVKSNRSNRSNRSNKSVKTSNIPSNSYLPSRNTGGSEFRSYLPPEESKIRTFVPPQSQQREERLTRSNYNYWKEQNLNNKYEQRYNNDQFKLFTRNPITITNTSNPPQFREPERDLNQSIQRSKNSNDSDYFYEFSNPQKPNKENTMVTENQKSSGMEWNASFGGSMRNSKLTPITERVNTAPTNLQQQKVEQAPKSSTLQTLSPLAQKSSVSNKSSLIISAGLIALGIIILLVQIIK